MKITRRVLGVIVGYALFVASAVLLFRITGRNPHAAQDGSFMIASALYGMAFAAFGGYVSAALAGGWSRVQAVSVGMLIATGATASLLTSPGVDSRWSMWSALLLMAPSALLGGIVHGRQGSGGRRPRESK
jgi:hypothetical protein